MYVYFLNELPKMPRLDSHFRRAYAYAYAYATPFLPCHAKAMLHHVKGINFRGWPYQKEAKERKGKKKKRRSKGCMIKKGRNRPFGGNSVHYGYRTGEET